MCQRKAFADSTVSDRFSAFADCRSNLDRVNYERPLCGMLLKLRYSRCVPEPEVQLDIQTL